MTLTIVIVREKLKLLVNWLVTKVSFPLVASWKVRGFFLIILNDFNIITLELDGKIVTGSGDMMITVWDLEAGKKLDQTPAHVGDVCSMSLKVEQNIIVTGSVDRCIKLWDVRTLKCTQTFFGHEADVNSVCVS